MPHVTVQLGGVIYEVKQEVATSREELLEVVQKHNEDDRWIDCEDNTSVRWDLIESMKDHE